CVVHIERNCLMRTAVSSGFSSGKKWPPFMACPRTRGVHSRQSQAGHRLSHTKSKGSRCVDSVVVFMVPESFSSPRKLPIWKGFQLVPHAAMRLLFLVGLGSWSRFHSAVPVSVCICARAR